MTTIEQLDTPSVMIDLDVLDRNLRKTAELASKAGVKLRPHTKTHKSVWIAKEQIRYGACGITVAKLGEAEVMAEGGIEDILIAFPIVGASKLDRLERLMSLARITVSTDNVEVAKGLSDMGVRAGFRVPLYVDINTGLGRCGGEPGAETVELVKRMADLPGVHIRGIMTHAGHAYGKTGRDDILAVARNEAESLVLTSAMLGDAGIPIEEVSVGSTPTSKFIGELGVAGVTEMRPGAYVFGDISQYAIGLIEASDFAMKVKATVVSMPRAGTIIVDAGSKTITTDVNAHRKGYGMVVGHESAIVERLSEEHGNILVPDNAEFRIGDAVYIVPNHCCTVTNLHDRLVGVRDGMVEKWIQVDGRGKVQ
ncbi:alanine racemase [Paenibacillus koleovorans]|uniref:alanine racemase n=1 Tax=Paenibacillus koleovorans TaxID=121608 RepID=UPI000FDBF51A|nr:alanine racemase [Paenibacillus koleovorans]